jgi:hypothetical protein
LQAAIPADVAAVRPEVSKMRHFRPVTEFSTEGQAKASNLARIDEDRLSDLDFFRRSTRSNPDASLVEKYAHLRRVGLLNLGDILKSEGLAWGEEVHLSGRRYMLGEDGAAVYLGPAPCPSDDDDITPSEEKAEWASYYYAAVAVN